jgi:GGDEF domain-containing protein
MTNSNGHHSKASDRDRQAIARDEVAQLRDLAARAGDDAAESRERWADAKLDALDPQAQSREELVEGFRRSTAATRTLTVADRARSAADRQLAARDRAQAALDRRGARIDLRRFLRDEFEGVYAGPAGQLVLQREIDRARRSGEPLALAFVDVGVEQDERARRAIHGVAAHLRSYDAVVRMDGGEFACAFTNTSLETARRRMSEIQAALERDGRDGPISVGFAVVDSDEGLEELTDRRARGGAPSAS